MNPNGEKKLLRRANQVTFSFRNKRGTSSACRGRGRPFFLLRKLQAIRWQNEDNCGKCYGDLTDTFAVKKWFCWHQLSQIIYLWQNINVFDFLGMESHTEKIFKKSRKWKLQISCTSLCTEIYKQARPSKFLSLFL